MSIIRPAHDWDTDQSEVAVPEPLSASQAQALRERSPSLSPWWVVVGQAAVAALAALLARGLMSRFSSTNAVTASFGFFVWDLVKISVSVAMLFLAPQMVMDL